MRGRFCLPLCILVSVILIFICLNKKNEKMKKNIGTIVNIKTILYFYFHNQYKIKNEVRVRII